MANYFCNKQVGIIYEVACWGVCNIISFKAINKGISVQCGCYFLDSYQLYKGVMTKYFCETYGVGFSESVNLLMWGDENLFFR